MNTLAIIDFNRTIYDPEKRGLLPGAKEVLLSLVKRGVILSLVSRIEPGRADILCDLGLTDIFASTHFVNTKSPQLFTEIIFAHRSDTEHAYVIGDYLHEEIRSGNRAGARTIWLRRGPFAHMRPESEFDVPWKEITDIAEIEALIGK